jgi:hypothetical protein
MGLAANGFEETNLTTVQWVMVVTGAIFASSWMEAQKWFRIWDKK